MSYKLNIGELVQAMRFLYRELSSLKQRGFVAENRFVPGGWQVRPQLFLWWLSNELLLMAQEQKPSMEWLAPQEWQRYITLASKHYLDKTLSASGELKDGIKVASVLVDRADLRRKLAAHFDKDELRTLCFDLEIGYGNLPDTTDGMARELVTYCERHERIPELITECERLRPEVSWIACPTADLERSPKVFIESVAKRVAEGLSKGNTL